MRKGIKKEMTDDIIIDCKNNAMEQIKIVRHDLKQAHSLHEATAQNKDRFEKTYLWKKKEIIGR